MFDSLAVELGSSWCMLYVAFCLQDGQYVQHREMVPAKSKAQAEVISMSTSA